MPCVRVLMVMLSLERDWVYCITSIHIYYMRPKGKRLHGVVMFRSRSSSSRDNMVKGNAVVLTQTLPSAEIGNVGAITVDQSFRLEVRSPIREYIHTSLSWLGAFLNNCAPTYLVSITNHWVGHPSSSPFSSRSGIPIPGKGLATRSSGGAPSACIACIFSHTKSRHLESSSL